MLDISRRKNEGIVIGDKVFVTVIEIRDDNVRLGIEIPTEMAVHRGGLLDAIRQAEEETKQPA